MSESLRRYCAEDLRLLAEQGLRRRLRVWVGPPGPRARVDGREVIALGSNDYLGLAGHPAVRKAAGVAMAAHGVGSGGARLVCGNRPLHEELEEALAAWKGTDAAVLFNTGYMANLGTIAALAGPGDLIVSDELNHASIIDGCRLSRAEVRVYRHADPQHAGEILGAERGRFRRCLLVTDGVFSMDGDLAPLPELCGLAEGHDAWLMVDDAHATGVLGETGAGTAEHLGVEGRVPIQMGTLGKALGAEGGFVAGGLELAEFLRHRSRPFVFSTAPAPAVVAAALAAVEVARREPALRRAVREHAAYLRRGLADLGFRVPVGETPIIPVLVGEAVATMRLADALLERGVFAPCIRPPAVPPGTSRLRVTVSAAHGRDDLDMALEAFAAAGRAVGVIPG